MYIKCIGPTELSAQIAFNYLIIGHWDSGTQENEASTDNGP